MKDGLYYLTGPLPVTPLPEEDPDAWEQTRVVGRPLPRVDGYERLSGAAEYPSDVVLPEMLYAAVLRCPHPHARVRRLETARAASMPGVRAVIHDGTAGADIAWHRSRTGPLSRLFDPHCRHEGQEVAAVAAETPYQAWDAVRAIEVDYEVLPFVVDTEEALKPGAPEVWEGGNQQLEPWVYRRGDVAQGFAEADVVLEQRFRTACQLHTPMELHGCVAKWDGNQLTVWESTQGVYNVQQQLAESFGLPASHVRVIGHYVGGGFGSKLRTGKYSAIATLLARKTGRPVKLFLTREETMHCVGNRPPNVMRLKAGVKRDGTLTALEFEGWGTGGAYSAVGTTLLEWQVQDLYRCPHVHSVTYDAHTHTGTQRPMRAPGHPQGSWALEQMLDALAAKLGMDPVEIRRKNLAEVSQGRDGVPYTSNGFDECLERGAREFGWSEARSRPRGDGPIVRGVGMAGGLWIAGAGGPPSTVVLRYFSDESVNLNMGASDIGTGTKTVMAMVVAEELAVPLERIRIEHADTATTQFATASGGSKTVPTEAPAVRAAALECKRKILEMASSQLGLPARSLRLEPGRVIASADPETHVAIGAIEQLQRSRVVVGVGYRGPNPAGKATCPFGAQFCEVEVNTRTGEVKILRFLAAHDSGRVMNRLTYDSQVFGGIVMGIGFGTTERRDLDERQTGKMVNRNLHDYKIPTALDVPAKMTSVPVEPRDTECNSTGAKGLGEPVTVPTAPAIANAVFHATGIRITETPLNPIHLVERLAAREWTEKRS